MTEMYRYPYLLAGWFGLFVTALNMIPVGQLDGGHILYAMFGEKKHSIVAHIIVMLMGIVGMLGILEYSLNLNFHIGWIGWLFWVVLLVFIIKIKHPPAYTFQKLGTGRMVLGFISFVIFILSFSLVPISVSLN
jgi:membrane-associated protease RseP (regulator of RpoE activity)